MGGWEDIIYSKKGKAGDAGQSRQEGKLSGNKGGSSLEHGNQNAPGINITDSNGLCIYRGHPRLIISSLHPFLPP